MITFNFWQKWLFIIGIYLSCFGLFLSFFNQSNIMNYIFNDNINASFWGNEIISGSTLNFQSWVYGILGATISGWGIFLSFLAYYPFKAREKWSWNCIAIGISIWFLSDTYISYSFNVSFNIIFNFVILFLIGIPIVFSRKYFKTIDC